MIGVFGEFTRWTMDYLRVPGYGACNLFHLINGGSKNG
jgi:hypothetical protein